MIPRLQLTNSGRVSSPVWPDPDRDDGSHLFSARKAYRKVVVMVDADLLAPQRGALPGSKAELLTALLDSPLVRLFRYADDGPPAGTPSLGPHPMLHDGWAVVADHDPARGWDVVFSSAPGSWTMGGVIGNAVDVAGHDVSSPAYEDLDAAERGQRRRADALAVQVAGQALSADIYVTERPYVHIAQWLRRDVTACSVAEAVALLGFYRNRPG